MLEGEEGRFANRPYGGLAERLNVTGDHKGRPYGRKGRRGMMLEGEEGRFANRPYGGLAERLNVTGDHKGRPYGRNGRGRGMGPRIREDNGRGEMPGVGREGKGGSRTAPTGTGEGNNERGRRNDRRRQRGRGMGPRIREDKGGESLVGARWLACGIAGAAAGGGSRCLPEPRSSCRRTLPSDSRGPTCPP